MRIYSVGHGARSLDEFVKVLASAKIATLVDVRSFPGSRRHPQFGKEALAASLPARGVEYAWEPRLGGRRKRGPVPSPNPSWQVEAFRNYADHLDSEEFAAGLQALVARAAEQPTACMSAETN